MLSDIKWSEMLSTQVLPNQQTQAFSSIFTTFRNMFITLVELLEFDSKCCTGTEKLVISK